MTTKVINVQQGSDEWLSIRSRYNTASEAPVMMGASAKASRNDLLRIKSTGNHKEISDWVQRHLFDKGHDFEARAREIIEEQLCEQLYPVTLANDELGLLASLDGQTMDNVLVFEHKMWNNTLAQAVRENDLPAEYYWQLEQELLLSGAERVLFVVSDGTTENMEQMFYEPVAGRAGELLAGWALFKEDLSMYVYKPEAEKVIGTAIQALPSLSVMLTGEVKSSNLAAFKERADLFLGAINFELNDDQDFADAANTVKFLENGERNLESVKTMALSQMATVDEVFNTLDHYKASMRDIRLKLTKMVDKRKVEVKVEIRTAALAEIAKHIETINTRLGKVRLPEHNADIDGAMRNKRNLTNLKDAVDAEVARVKLDMNAKGEIMSAGLAVLRERATKYPALFQDAQALVLKPVEDLTVIVDSRIKAEDERIAAEEAATEKRLREKIEKENADAEAARLKKEADDAAAAAKAEADAEAAKAQEAAKPVIDTSAPTQTQKPPLGDSMTSVPSSSSGWIEKPQFYDTDNSQVQDVQATLVEKSLTINHLDRLLRELADDEDLQRYVTIDRAGLTAYIKETGHVPDGCDWS